jgi:hypothetical protein
MLLTPAVGFRHAAWTALLAGAMTVMLAEGAALSIATVPFTRPYVPGHARLRTRWPLYALGVYLCAYRPARMVLLADDETLVALLAFVVAVAVTLHVLGRRLRTSGEEPAGEDTDEVSSVTVLALGPTRADGARVPAA